MAETAKPDLIIFDITKPNKELSDMIMHLKNEIKIPFQLAGYSTREAYPVEEKIENNLDLFIPQATVNMEAFLEKIKKVLLQS